MATADLASLRLESFQQLEDRQFRIVDLGLDARLIEIKPGQSRQHHSFRQPFSLMFLTESMPGQRIQQGMLQFEHSGLGTLELFVVALGVEKEGMLFEAVFA